MNSLFYAMVYSIFGACIAIIAEAKERKHASYFEKLRLAKEPWYKVAISLILIAIFWPIFVSIALYYKMKGIRP